MIPAARLTIRRPAERDAWLATRTPFFNASATAVLFDRHPFMSAKEYAVEKLTGEGQAETRAMRRGTYLEAGIAEWYTAEYGVRLVEPDVLFVAERVMATADRLTATGADKVIEIKTTSHRMSEPDQYWLDQVQAVMYATGIDVAVIVWVDPSMDMQVAEVDADEGLQREIAERAERFMAAIDMQIIPDWVGGEMTADLVTKLYPDPAGSIEVGDEVVGAIAEYRYWRTIRDEAEQEMAGCRDFVAAALGPAEVGTFEGVPVVSYKRVAGASKLNRKRLEADHPDIVRQYLETQPGGRRFLPAS